MKIYLVCITDRPATGTAEQVEASNEIHLFKPLRALAENMTDNLVIVNELRITGIAIVDATDEGVQKLKELGYIVEESQTRRVI